MKPAFEKFTDGLVPAIVQDAVTRRGLMLGYMNAEALAKTQNEMRVTFYSRSKKSLWTKGEESGNYLDVSEIKLDCDRDAILILAKPHGPVCHTGADTCFVEKNISNDVLNELERIIYERKNNPSENSYTASLFAKDNNGELFRNEAADLLFHYLVLLAAKDTKLEDVLDVLRKRHKK